MRNPLRRRKGKDWTKAAFNFTGTCPVRQHTGDGHYVGRCDHSTYGGHCHLHGDVARWLGEDADLADADDRRIAPRR